MAFASKKFTARGFSLLEVLVAVVILSIGLLALASLQISMMRASSATKSQTLAANLAKDKLESLRSYTSLAGYLALTSATSPGTTDPLLADVAGSQGGVDFTRQYLITRYVYNKEPAGTVGFLPVANTLSDAGLIALKDSTHDYLLGKDFKRVTVKVSWNDAAGVGQSVAMEDVIDGLDPTESASIVKAAGAAGSPRTLEEIIVDPALDNMVIPIALGGGVDSAATNPKPTVVVGNNTVETRFDVLTYAGINSTLHTATAQQKVETVMVGCTCTLTSPPASTVRGMRPTYWNSFRYATPVDVAASGSESYSPPGKVDPSSAASQSTHCDICCRDHVDPVGVKGATFSPRLVTKNTSDVVTAKHDHYFDKLAGSPATSGTYKEACRVIRVDGIWRVAADLENDHFGLLATGDGTSATSYAPDTTSAAGTPAVIGATTRYQNFVLGYMDSRFVSNTPTTGTEQATYNTVGAPVTLAASAPYVLDNPSSVTLSTPFTGTPSCTAITGISKANPAVVTHSATYTNCAAGGGVAFVNGDRVYIKNVTGMTAINNPGGSYVVANATATTFELSGLDTSVAAYAAYASGGLAEVSHGKWLHSRGVYVDFLEKEAVDAITAAKADPACSGTLSLCVLKLLPFTSINLTEIADWDSADPSRAIVTNNNYSQTLTSLEPVRGESYFAGGANGSTVNVNSRSRRYNTSLLDLSFDSISSTDDNTTLNSDSQVFTINNLVPVTKPGGGSFYTGLSLPLVSGMAVSYLTGTLGSKSCASFPAANSPNAGFRCDVNNQESTTIAPLDPEDAGLGIANTMAIQISGYNSTGTRTSTTSVPNCTGPFGNKTYVSVTTGAMTGRSDPAKYTLNTCSVSSVTAASNLTTSVNATGTAPYTVVGTGQAQTTTIRFPNINADPILADATYIDKLSVTFSSPTVTTQGVASCTYTCTALNGGGTNCANVSTTRFTITSSACP